MDKQSDDKSRRNERVYARLFSVRECRRQAKTLHTMYVTWLRPTRWNGHVLDEMLCVLLGYKQACGRLAWIRSRVLILARIFVKHTRRPRVNHHLFDDERFDSEVFGCWFIAVDRDSRSLTSSSFVRQDRYSHPRVRLIRSLRFVCVSHTRGGIWKYRYNIY